ncbi:MAG: hypothetical protein CMP77_15625 [Flavobacterium sp.]|nr:hypothetical protein [Flavobacterium sp.]
MKRLNLVLGAALIAAGLTSCKNDAEMAAEKSVDRYESFVDSIDRLDDEERMANWEAIEAQYEARLAEAEAALENLKDREGAETRINDKKTKYDEVKMEASQNMNQASADNSQTLYVSFFGEGNGVGNDMDFTWVNKDNILSVYENFVKTFEANKDNYSREDFDKIKNWYEALDARKNTVEKEGLSAEDNRKIAALKVEFAPKFKWERMTAKSQENENAKEAAE